MILIEGKNKNLAKRYCSNVIDYTIVIILVALSIYAFGEPNDSGGYSVIGVKALIIPVIWFLYFPVCEAFASRTIGKIPFDLYVVDPKGECPNLMQTFLRRMLDPVELFFIGIPGLVAINHSAANQRLGDMMAGTIVVCTHATCPVCGASLELNTQEVANKVFQCPTCHSINQKKSES